MARLRKRDIVDITVKGVRVDAEHADGTVSITAEHPDGGPATWHMPPQAKIERVMPAEWPPHPGDLWRDRSGLYWLALNNRDDQTDDRILRSITDERCLERELLKEYGPPTLVHRDLGVAPF